MTTEITKYYMLVEEDITCLLKVHMLDMPLVSPIFSISLWRGIGWEERKKTAIPDLSEQSSLEEILRGSGLNVISNYREITHEEAGVFKVNLD